MSWTQAVPRTSLDFIHSFNLSRQARILDVGGGDSHLVDFLLDKGFGNVTVLNISTEALDRARRRLGEKARQVKWVVSDITEFQPAEPFDCCHERATFHFLTTHHAVGQYLTLARHSVWAGGFVTIGTFSENGSEKCSGLPIRKYSEMSLQTQLKNGFENSAA